MQPLLQNIRLWITTHKKVSAAIVIALIVAGYGAMRVLGNTAGTTRYVLAAVEKGTVIASISGTGQVSATNQVSLKPKFGGDVTAVAAVAGQKVTAGAAIAYFDTATAQKAVRDAQVNFESAQLALQKLQQPANASTALSTQNAVASATESKDQAQQNLTKSYEDGYSQVADAFLSLQTAVSAMSDILNHSYLSDFSIRLIGTPATGYRTDADTAYYAAKDAVDKGLREYKSLSRDSNQSQIETLIDDTYQASKTSADALKTINTLVDYMGNQGSEKNRPAELAADQSSLSAKITEVNGHLATLLATRQAIENDKSAISSADRTIAEKQAGLTELKRGADQLDLQSAQLSVTQRQNALTDARQQLADYTVRAPFDGVVGQVNVKKGDAIAASDIVAIVLSESKLAEISLNEVDVAKVKTGQKATLIFDAIDGLSITGHVVEVDLVGAVTQGVVSYKVKIAFDTNDDRVKSSMTVSAHIITDMKQDVLMVPAGAVKTQGNVSYVQVVDQVSATAAGQNQTAGVILATAPRQVAVTTGLSSDTSTEIISGVEEGQQVVTRTISPTATTAPAATTNTRGGGLGVPRGFGG